MKSETTIDIPSTWLPSPEQSLYTPAPAEATYALGDVMCLGTVAQTTQGGGGRLEESSPNKTFYTV